MVGLGAGAQVDILSWRNKTARVHAQVRDICAILSGLVVAQDYRRGQALVVNRNFADNAEFFQARPTAAESVATLGSGQSWLPPSSSLRDRKPLGRHLAAVLVMAGQELLSLGMLSGLGVHASAERV